MEAIVRTRDMWYSSGVVLACEYTHRNHLDVGFISVELSNKIEANILHMLLLPESVLQYIILVQKTAGRTHDRKPTSSEEPGPSTWKSQRNLLKELCKLCSCECASFLWCEVLSCFFFFVWNTVCTCFLSCLIWWDLPEAMKEKAMEADRLFRRGCLQYLEDLGLQTKQTQLLMQH